MRNHTKTSTRVEWIDIAKGITILLVIVGHTVLGTLRGIIFSFHMPLFFILSCATYNLSANNDEFVQKSEKAAFHLLLPSAGILLIQRFISVSMQFPSLSTDFLMSTMSNAVNTFIAGSGVDVNVGNTQISAIGIPWFLMALFGGRTLFDYLHLRLDNNRFFISIALCVYFGIWFGIVQWLPFSFDIALAIQPFFLFGYWLKKYNMKGMASKIIVPSLILWSVLLVLSYYIKHSYLELAVRRYPLFPICYVTAVAGTMFISSFSQLISGFKHLSIPLQYLGRHSLVMLWVHCFDYYYSFAYTITPSLYFNAMVRVFADLIIFCLATMILSNVKKLNKLR